MTTQTNPGALAGIRVIDLTRVLGGPYCTQILGDHGADVIKIEPPTGDETRGWGPPFRDGDASYFIGVNRNKQAVALDFTKPEARELLFRLLEDADVLVENFKAGTLERWGIGYEQTLRARFPRLIHARVSGFGSDGPLGGRVGYDAVIQGMAGLMSVNGERGGPPLRLGIPIIDLATGLNTAIGILMALIERGKSGQGRTSVPTTASRPRRCRSSSPSATTGNTRRSASGWGWKRSSPIRASPPTATASPIATR
jgi:crotonobetainyl-CoA:carnitine CoA-transferase CaiB-like acyl-CoA transferase